MFSGCYSSAAVKNEYMVKMVDTFFTDTELLNFYNIYHNELPKIRSINGVEQNLRTHRTGREKHDRQTWCLINNQA